MKRLLLRMLPTLIRVFGSKIRDARTGAVIGRALLVPWKGKIHFIGTTGVVEPVFLPQERLTYWKQELGFAKLDPVDFPREPRS